MMKTRIGSRGRAIGLALALGTLGLTAPRARVEAQVHPRATKPDECRCVDKAGEPIEHCSCLRVPEMGRILRQAFPTGRVRLGVTLAEAKEGSESRGAEVSSVMEGGPAEKAGIEKGDILTRVAGKSLLQPLAPEVEKEFDPESSLPVQRVIEIVKGIEPGEKVAVEYLRGGERATVTLEARDLDTFHYTVVGPDWDPEAFQGRMRDLGERLRGLSVQIGPEGRELRILRDSTWSPGTFLWEAPEPPEPPEPPLVVRPNRVWECPGGSASSGVFRAFSNRCVGGLELLELKPGLAEYFGTSEGVLVADVQKDSKLGLQPGDVILSVGERAVSDPERVRRILSSYAADETVTLRIMRQKREMTLTGTLGR